MTDPSYECPIDGCGYTGTFRQMQGHFSGSRDEEHIGSVSKADLDGQQISAPEPDDNGEGDNGEGDNVDEPEPDSNPLKDGPEQSPPTGTPADDNDNDNNDDAATCCDDPSYRSVDPGRKFITEDGRTAHTNDGDKICLACQAVVSADGGIYR